MIVYHAVPFLLVAALPVIVLLSVLIGGCTMTRPTNELTDRVQFQSEADSRVGEELRAELDRRAVREELRRVVGETQ
ncbi:hypothetical protein [Bradyrhizobium sp.]|uniref:hypothetical protein n=1 Tax=Bradyrhizobium sp. TaxID=376 RepID=UPI003C5FC28B